MKNGSGSHPWHSHEKKKHKRGNCGVTRGTCLVTFTYNNPNKQNLNKKTRERNIVPIKFWHLDGFWWIRTSSASAIPFWWWQWHQCYSKLYSFSLVRKVKKRVRHRTRRRICFHVPQRIYIKLERLFGFNFNYYNYRMFKPWNLSILKLWWREHMEL